MIKAALIRQLEVIGEAASKISNASRIKYEYIPWNKIIGMRNRLIHGYFDIDYNILWGTVTEFLPDLKLKLEEIIKDCI